MTLSELKNYLRIDHDFDDSLLEVLREGAVSYVNGAIEVQNPVDRRFDLAVALLVGHLYENRSATSEIALQDIPFGVEVFINQLRGLSYEENN